MHNSLPVHVFKCASHLVYEPPHLLLRKANLVFNGALKDQFEIALLGPFDRNKQLIQLVVDEPAQVLHDVHMI